MKIVFLMVIFFAGFRASAESVRLPKDFIFGVANAPAQVEDQLDDIWLDWSHIGKIAGWSPLLQPEQRLQFWTKPQLELDLAKNLGVGAFRMGIDWGRVMPSRTTIDVGAIRHYREIIAMAKQRNMKIMMTLSHHSVPKWVQASGGWHNEANKESFLFFAKRMMREFNTDVSWWITFNEANVFVTMAYTTGAWPPGEKHSALALMPLAGGSSITAMDRMAAAHNELYEWAHQTFPNIKIGIAHNMARYRGKLIRDNIEAGIADVVMNWHLPEKIRDHMDFFGMNYYGAEWLDGASIAIDPHEEYSEAGRAIDVGGFYDLLTIINTRFPNLPILITENGIADESDSLRSTYMIEHLAVIQRAIAKRIPVQGYFVWTLTDNLEWSDGYCPKFGLVSIDRKTMQRTPRPSFNLYRQIIATKTVTEDQRASAWNHVVQLQGHPHGFCRGVDGATSLAIPRMRPYSHKDWRFKPAN